MEPECSFWGEVSLQACKTKSNTHKEILYPLWESDFLAACPTRTDVREALRGTLRGADISAQAWGSSLLHCYRLFRASWITRQHAGSFGPPLTLPLCSSEGWGSTSQTLGSPLAGIGQQTNIEPKCPTRERDIAS